MRKEDVILRGVIKGHLPSGKNNYVLSDSRMYRAPEVMAYEQAFIYQANLLRVKNKLTQPVPAHTHNGKRPVWLGLIAQVFFQSYRRDVDTILFCDLLQKSNIIENDRMIRVKLINGAVIDKKNPRVEFELHYLNKDDELFKYFKS